MNEQVKPEKKSLFQKWMAREIEKEVKAKQAEFDKIKLQYEDLKSRSNDAMMLAMLNRENARLQIKLTIAGIIICIWAIIIIRCTQSLIK